MNLGHLDARIAYPQGDHEVNTFQPIGFAAACMDMIGREYIMIDPFACLNKQQVYHMVFTMECTQPDFLQAISMLRRHMRDPGIRCLELVRVTLRYVDVSIWVASGQQIIWVRDIDADCWLVVISILVVEVY